MAVKLFVGGLAFATSSDRLREAFATIGTVASVRVVTDPAGQSRGFGFVEMETIEAAQDAISRLHGSDLDGRAPRSSCPRRRSRAERGDERHATGSAADRDGRLGRNPSASDGGPP